MANTQTWQAFLVLDEARWQFLGLSPWQDQLLRWCRQTLRPLSGDGDLGRLEVILYSCDDRPSPSKRKPRFRPFSWDAPPQDGWHQERVFHHPFEELLTKRDRERSNGTADAAHPRRRYRGIPAPTQIVGAGTAFDEPSPSAVVPESAQAHNNLLSWLSAAGVGRWDAFLRTSQVLGLAQDGRQARRIIRRLILLGHLTSDDGVRWAMQLPTLAPLTLEPERVVLRGQRTPALLTCLPDNREDTAQSGGPDRVCCCVPLEKGVPTISVGTVCFRVEPCALVRAQALPDCRAWVESLRRFDERDLGKFVRTERWDGADWIGTPVYYDQPAHRIVGPSGMYRLRQEVSARSPLTVCFDAEGQRIVRGDWYGLRFLAGRLGGARPCVEWAREDREFFIPAEERWPFRYEQILVQASGLLPSRSKRPGWLCYHGIDEALANCLCEKLEADIHPIASIVSIPHHHATT